MRRNHFDGRTAIPASDNLLTASRPPLTRKASGRCDACRPTPPSHPLRPQTLAHSLGHITRAGHAARAGGGVHAREQRLIHRQVHADDAARHLQGDHDVRHGDRFSRIEQSSSLCSIGTAIPPSRPCFHAASRAAEVTPTGAQRNGAPRASAVDGASTTPGWSGRARERHGGNLRSPHERTRPRVGSPPGHAETSALADFRPRRGGGAPVVRLSRPEIVTGLRSGNSATSRNCPPMAST